jgi:hypothetical protein
MKRERDRRTWRCCGSRASTTRCGSGTACRGRTSSAPTALSTAAAAGCGCGTGIGVWCFRILRRRYGRNRSSISCSSRSCCGTALSSSRGSCTATTATSTTTRGRRRAAASTSTTPATAAGLGWRRTDFAGHREIFALQLALPVHVDIGTAKIARRSKRHCGALNGRTQYRPGLKSALGHGSGERRPIQLQIDGNRLGNAMAVCCRQLADPLSGNTTLRECRNGRQREDQKQC